MSMTPEQIANPVETIARYLYKFSTASEGGYRYVPGKYRWGQMTKITQRRFMEIAENMYREAIAPLLAAARREGAGQERPYGCQHGEDPTGQDRECLCPDQVELEEWEARQAELAEAWGEGE